MSAAPPPQAKKSHARPPTPSQDTDSSHASGSGSRALSGSIASNRKRIPVQDSGSTDSNGDGSASASVPRSPSRERIQIPLAPSGLETITPEALREELRGKESAVGVIQAKLDQWEATTLATLQEIRDLKQIFLNLAQ